MHARGSQDRGEYLVEEVGIKKYVDSSEEFGLVYKEFVDEVFDKGFVVMDYFDERFEERFNERFDERFDESFDERFDERFNERFDERFDGSEFLDMRSKTTG